MEVIHYTTLKQIAEWCPTASKMIDLVEPILGPAYQDKGEFTALVLGWLYGYDKPDTEAALETITNSWLDTNDAVEDVLAKLNDLFIRVKIEFYTHTRLDLMPCHFYESEQDGPLGQWGVKGMCRYTPAGEKFAEVFTRQPIVE